MSVAAQADLLSKGFEHLVGPSQGRSDTRSRSLEHSPHHRNSLKVSRYLTLTKIYKYYLLLIYLDRRKWPVLSREKDHCRILIKILRQYGRNSRTLINR